MVGKFGCVWYISQFDNTLMVMRFLYDTPYEGSCTLVMLPNDLIAAYVQTHGI